MPHRSIRPLRIRSGTAYWSVMVEEGLTVDATAMDGPLERVASDDEFQSPATSPPPVMSSGIKVFTYVLH